MGLSKEEKEEQRAHQLIQKITYLAQNLLASVPEATTDDSIYRIFTREEPSDDPYTPFNRKFDAAFTQPPLERDAETGRLENIRRGQYGMDLVVKFLAGLDVVSLPLDLVNTKLEIGIKEMLEYVPTSVKSTVKKRSWKAPSAPSKTSIQKGSGSGKDKEQANKAAEKKKSRSAGAKAGRGGDDASTSKSTRSKEAVAGIGGKVTAPDGLTADGGEKRVARNAEDTIDKEVTNVDSEGNGAKGRGADTSRSGSDDESDASVVILGHQKGGGVPKKSNKDGGESGVATFGHRKKRAVTSDSKESEDDSRGKKNGKKSAKARPSSTKRRRLTKRKASNERSNSDDNSDASKASEPLSDGKTAYRKVKADAEERSQARRGPKSNTHLHYKTPVPCLLNGEKRWRFKCKYCSSAFTFKRTVPNTKAWGEEPSLPFTGNLTNHILNKHRDRRNTQAVDDDSDAGHLPDTGVGPGSRKLLEDFAQRGFLNPAREATQQGFYRVFAAWLLDDDLPWTTGETPSIKRLFDYLKVKFYLPSDTTVSNYVKRLFAEMYQHVVTELTELSSKISYAEDTWTTKGMSYSFSGILAHFINDDWELVRRLIDFEVLSDKDHQGIHAARAFVKSARSRGGLDKICLTMDNASPNDVMARTLAHLLWAQYHLHWDSEEERMRCMGHVINLVAQAMLHAISEADDPDVEDYFDIHKSEPIHLDEDLAEKMYGIVDEEIDASKDKTTDPADAEDDDDEEDEDVDENWSDEELHDLIEQVEDTETADAQMRLQSASAVKKIRTICTKICSSPQRRHAFRRIAKRVCGGKKASEKLDPKQKHRDVGMLMVLRDVATRWNSTQAMLRRSLILQDAIKKWIRAQDKLDDLKLTSTEWELISDIDELLSPLTEMTFEISKEGLPTLPFTIPLYRKLHIHLTKMKDHPNASICSAAQAGLNKLSTYYETALNNKCCLIATALHPKFRSEWFAKAYDDEKKKEVEAIVALELEKYREQVKKSPAAVYEKSDHSRNSSSVSLLDTLLDDMHVDDTAKKGSEKDEFVRYFKDWEGPDCSVNDVLLWWKTHGCILFPALALMARDYLAIPATSISVERLFSTSRHLCTDVRNSLKASTITRAMCTKHWIREGLLGDV